MSRTSVDQALSHSPDSSPVSQKSLGNSTQRQITHVTPLCLHQTSLNASEMLNRPTDSMVTVSSEQWQSAVTTIGMEDDFTDDDIDEEAAPWSKRENFTHQLRADRPQDQDIIISHDIDHQPDTDEDVPLHQIMTSDRQANVLPMTTTTHVSGSQNHQRESSRSRIHLPSSYTARSICPSNSVNFLVVPLSAAASSTEHSSSPIPSDYHVRGTDTSSTLIHHSVPRSQGPINNTHPVPVSLRQRTEPRRTALTKIHIGPSPSDKLSIKPVQSYLDPQAPHTAPFGHSMLTTCSYQQPSRSPARPLTSPQGSGSPLSNAFVRHRSFSDTFVLQSPTSPITDPLMIHGPLGSPQSIRSLLRVGTEPEDLTMTLIRTRQFEQEKWNLNRSTAREPVDSESATELIHSPEAIRRLFGSHAPEPHRSTGSRLSLTEDSRYNDLDIVDTPEARKALNVKADFVIGVAGPKGVGKSTIISKALRKTASTSVLLYEDRSQNKISSIVSNLTNNATGSSKILQILEIDQAILTDKFIKKSDKKGLTWPEKLPSVDGVLLCYDAMDSNALEQLRPLLHSFWTRGGISLIVLACKSSKDEHLNATSPLKAAELVNVYGTGMIQLDGGLDDPSRKMRNSFNWIIKAIKEARGQHRSYSSASTNILGSLCDDDQPSRSSSIAALRHSHSTSTSSAVDQISQQPLQDPSENPVFHRVSSHPQMDDADSDSFSKNALVAMSYEKSTRPDGSFRHDTSLPSSPKDLTLSTTLPEEVAIVEPQQPSSPVEAAPDKTNVAAGDDLAFAACGMRSMSGKHAAQKAIVMSQRGSGVDLYYEKSVIIDKFVFATVSGNEPSFIDQFLTVFRRFATPFDVLSALIARFEFVTEHLQTDPLLGRYAHLKICHVLMSWIETYPGDFVNPATLNVLMAFNSLMLSVTWLLHYAVEIMPMIKLIGTLRDEDAGWALPDKTEDSVVEKVSSSINKLYRTLAVVSPRARRSTLSASTEEQFLPSTPHTGKSNDDHPPSDSSPHVDAFSTAIFSNEQVNSTAASSPVVAMNTNSLQDRHYPKVPNGDSADPSAPAEPVENFQISNLPLKTTATSSTHQSDQKSEHRILLECSNLLLSIPNECIALQITRLEWNIFSQMKPRHLIRYVLAPRDPTNPRKALRDPESPISRSTDYLNYLATWASSMILIQEKLKCRAKVLLKLMKVAYELRDVDDFHSLMGVLAGIEAQPVYRLEAIFDLVQQMDLVAYRRYLSLKKLMSSQRSFSAYRLARQTAGSQCVPYLGTYLQDITAVQEVKDDMQDGKVNLTKFIQIAKSALAVLNCAVVAPKIYSDQKISSLIVKVPVLSEDMQYELSYKYKPRVQNSHYPGGGGGGMSVIKGSSQHLIANTNQFLSQSTPNSSLGASNGNPTAVGVNVGGVVNPTPPTMSSAGPSTSSSSVAGITTGLGSLHVGVGATQVAKKGTRKLKQLLTTAMSSNSHNHN